MLTNSFKTLTVDELRSINESKKTVNNTNTLYSLDEFITLRVLEWLRTEERATTASITEHLATILTEMDAEAETETSVQEWLDHSSDLFNINKVTNESEGSEEEIYSLSTYGSEVAFKYVSEKEEIDSEHTVEIFKK